MAERQGCSMKTILFRRLGLALIGALLWILFFSGCQSPGYDDFRHSINPVNGSGIDTRLTK